MGKTLVTGGTGFLGSHLARSLAGRGDELRLLIRRSTEPRYLDGIEFERANGEVTNRRAVRRAMKGVDRVFHVAGRTSLRPSDAEAVFEANVIGTRTVLEEALHAGVERVVHTSSVAALGPAERNSPADESQPFDARGAANAYVNSKHEAELEALRLGAKGLPVVIVNPTFVLGPEDPKGTSMGLVRRFLLRRIPAYVDGGLNIVDVRDVAEGHLLAERRGEVGDRYILGGRNFTLQRLFADLSRNSGVAAPALRVPGRFATAGAELGSRLGLPIGTSVDEVRSASRWWWYSNAKAKRKLRFRPRPHEETLRDAVEWQAAELGDRVAVDDAAYELPMRALGQAMRTAEKLIFR